MRLLLTAILISLFAPGAKAQFQGVIINEFSQGNTGNREYLELLIVGTRTCTDSTADLRGWIIDDQNGWYGNSNGATGHYRFKYDPNWANVPFGSIILIYNAGDKNLTITSADDPADANHDYNYIVPNTSTFLEQNASEPGSLSGPAYVYPTTGYGATTNQWPFIIALNNTGGDVISVVNPANLSAAFFSIGYGFTINAGFQSPTVSITNIGASSNAYLSNSNYFSSAGWIPGVVPTDETPGVPNGGANTSWIVSMRQQLAPAPGVSVTQPTCNNPLGTITITSPFGPAYSYSKDGVNYNQFNTIFTNLQQGTYPITLMNNGCVSPPTTVVISAAPTIPSFPVFTIAQPDCNNPTATITVTSPLGTDLTYSIGAGYQSSTVFTGVTTGIYGITAKNAAGCVSSANIFTVDAPPPPLPTPVVTITAQPTCANPTGSIVITSLPGMSYSVDGIFYNNTTGIFNNLAPGTYNITAKDAAGCITPATVVVINNPPASPESPVLSIAQTSCSSSTGSIIITSPTGAGLTYSIDATNYSSQTVYNGLVPGSYQVTVKDVPGCVSSIVPVVINPQPSIPATPVLNIVQPTCSSATGIINVTSPAGINYSLDGVNFTNTTGVFTNLAPGSYSISAQSGNGCISNAANAIINQQPATPTVSVNSPIVCPGSNTNLSATVSPAGSYTYVWTVPAGETNPGNTASFTAATAGVYSVTVTNIDGCNASASGSLSIVSFPPVIADDKTVCQNASVLLTAQPTGGTWSGAAVTGNVFDATGLAAGTYFVNYTYASGGCNGNATATITVAALPVVPITNVIQPGCTLATGTITVVSPSGSGFLYSIDNINFSSNNIFNNLSPNSYVVTVQNASGCKALSAPIVVNAAPPGPSTPVFTSIQPTCTIATGSITITSPIGTGLNYSIDGINYQSSTLFTNLASGNYNVTVQNALGCLSAAGTAIINTQPSVPASPVVNITQPSCNTTTGTITVVSPAGMNYSIDGINFNNTAGVFSNLTPGSYIVSAQNAAGCISSSTNAIINPQPLSPVVTVNSPSVCPGSSAAMIATVSPAGSYTYVWTVPAGEINPGNTGSFTASTAGNYSVMVTNAGNCSATASGVLSIVAVGTVTADDKTVCQNATVQLTGQPAGGTWSGSSVSGNLFNAAGLGPGNYTVNYSYTSGSCSGTATATIAVVALPAVPVIGVVQPNCTLNTGSITVNSPLGAGLNYSIDATNYSPNPVFFNLPPASYIVSVENVNGCKSFAAPVVVNAAPSSPSSPTFAITQPTCSVPTGSISITSPIGAGLSYSIDGLSYQGSTTFTGLTNGNYNVVVQNAAGCISPSSSAVINAVPGSPAAPAITIVQPTCTSALGSITVTSPTTTGLSYSIDGVNYQSSTLFANLVNGNYNVTVQNASGCVSPAMPVVIVVAPLSPPTPVVNVNQPTCLVATGTISINSPIGAGLNYSIDGVNYQSSNSFMNVASGNYNVSAQNASGCVSASTIAVIQTPPSAPAIPVVNVTQPGCSVTTGTITVSSPTGSGLTYSIDNLNYVSSTVFATLQPGTYTVQVKNNAGCISSTAATINPPQGVPAPPTISVLNHCDGTSTLTASNFSGALLWSNNSSTASIVVNTPGTYSVTQTVNGCISPAATAIAAPVITQILNQTINGCGIAEYNGNVYTTPAIVKDTLKSMNGCDSVIHIVNINIKQPSSSQVSVCKPPGQSYNFNGTILNTSGQYADTLVAANGCDSIVHLNLLIAVAQTNTVSGCESVNYNGITYTSSTVINQIIPSSVTSCDSIIRVTNIIVNPKPVITTTNDQVICKGDSARLTASSNNATIQWQGFGIGNSIVVTPIVTTTYTAIATNGAGCRDTGTVTIHVTNFDIQLVSSNNPVISGTSVQLTTSSVSSYQVLAWTPASLFADQHATNQVLAVDSTVTVTVLAQSTQGCRDSSQITISANPLDDIYIPSAFTPNGDGKNDVFRVLGGNIKSLELKVFNRWGEIIFNSNERSKGWDGTFAGREQPGAVYVYTVSVLLMNGQKVYKKGTVVLIR